MLLVNNPSVYHGHENLGFVDLMRGDLEQVLFHDDKVCKPLVNGWICEWEKLLKDASTSTASLCFSLQCDGGGELLPR